MELNRIIHVFSKLGRMEDRNIEQYYPHLYAELKGLVPEDGTGTHGIAMRIQVLLTSLAEETKAELRAEVRTLTSWID